MSTPLCTATWPEIESFRETLATAVTGAPDLAAASQAFAQAFVTRFSSVVLARVFVVTPLRALPPAEQTVARATAVAAGHVAPLPITVPVLALLGTAGTQPAWADRTRSAGHRAIPLVDAKFVEGAPMIAELLSALKVDLSAFGRDAGNLLRPMAGGLNQRFFVPDAPETTDARGRKIIGAQDFVHAHGVRSVFGMGGTYVDGTVVAAILFTTELLTTSVVDRYPSLIGTFKLATGSLVAGGALFPG